MLGCAGKAGCSCGCPSGLSGGLDVAGAGEIASAGASVLNSILGIGSQYLVGKQQKEVIKGGLATQARQEAQAAQERAFQAKVLGAQYQQASREQAFEAAGTVRSQEWWSLVLIGSGAVLLSGILLYQASKGRKR